MCSLLRNGCALLVGLAVFCQLPGKAEIVINEIMYQPPSGNPLEEYIELYNPAGTNVNLTGWRLSGGVDFNFPSNTIVNARGFLVVAANQAAFLSRYGNVSPLVGGWALMQFQEVGVRMLTNYANVLGNTRNTINLVDASGEVVDTVPYADEGEWAVRQRGALDLNYRGWTWYKPQDGLGSSLELRNPGMPNEFGQNWSASTSYNGTPGQANSVFTTNIPPLILNVAHLPIVPTSSDSVGVTARVVDEQQSGLTVSLFYRVDVNPANSFSSVPMYDDGAHRDGVAGDGLYGALLPPMANNTVVEFYLEAVDVQGNSRTWPAPAIAAPDGVGPTGQAANALYQVDDNSANRFGGTPSLQPVYKLIMTEVERAEMASMHSTASRSDAQMNGTFISHEGTGFQCRYLISIRNRGHSTRGSGNFRLGFRSDELWNDHLGFNLNLVNPALQVFGSTLAVKSGAPGAYHRAAQVRVNNANLSGAGSPTFGSYSVNEVHDGQWIDRHYPNERGGNIYRIYRDVSPAEMDYRGENPSSYQNTYFKENNITENDWLDLINMLGVMAVNGVDSYNAETASSVINVEKWLTHLAVMSLMGNTESGLNSGHNDDYFMYRGVNDPRFVLVFHDLDQLFNMGGQNFPDGPNDTIWGATYIQGSPTNTYQRSTSDNEGSGRLMYRFMHTPEFQQLYYVILQRLLDTSFSKAEFDALLDQVLTPWAPSVVNNIRNYMDARRVYVQGVIAPFVSSTYSPVATISGEPRSPSPRTGVTLTVGGAGITHYRYRLNTGSLGLETPVSTPIQLSGLPHGRTNTIYLIGKATNGVWQSGFTVSRSWVVLTNWPTVRLNEVLARNVSAFNHDGTYPDVIEFFNESLQTADLSGMRLTDDPSNLDQFTFPNGTVMASRSNLVVFANNPDGTPGIHLGFGLNQNGDGVYLYDAVANGGALLDSVVFGHQLADHSIGRVAMGGAWMLTEPSPGVTNTALPLGDERAVKINEWLASGQFPFSDDFVELYNPGSLPVDLGGLYLTDSPIGAPTQHRIPDLNFLGEYGFTAFVADGNGGQPDHLAFRLDADMGEVALLSKNLARIDNVIFAPQQTGVSIGRCPDGGATNRVQPLPSPGAGNICPQPPPEPQTVTLFSWSQSWNYENSGANLGTAWKETNYPDDSWPAGPGLLGVMRSGGMLPEPLRTDTGPLSMSKITWYYRTHFTVPAGANLTGLQLTHIIDDGAVFYINGNEVLRYNLPQPPNTIYNTTLASANILDATYSGANTIPLTYLVPGDNVLAVEVHQASPGSADIILGVLLEGLIVTNAPSQAGVVINEIFANNATVAEPDGSTPDWVELYNPSANAVDLAGTSLGDSSGNRWTFPAGSIIPAGGYYSVRFDADRPASATNTGFGLNSTGDLLALYDKAPNSNMPLDTNFFGLQIADFAIGRVPSGSANWRLIVPSIGSANMAAALGDPTRLSINEYMALPASGDDWFEVYNPNQQPVAIGGMYFTDDLAVPTKHKIAPLSFLGAQTNAWQKFIADNNPGAGTDHVAFRLAAANEAIGLADTNGLVLSAAAIPPYGQQEVGVSRGRFPDGSTNLVSFPNTPSPGDPNFLLLTNIVVNEVLAHTDPPLEDAIELHNPSASAVNIGGWWLSDAKGTPRKFQIPPNTMLPAGGFKVFYENQFNNVDVAVRPFALDSAGGDEVYLSATAGDGSLNGYRAFTDFGPSENGVSFGRYRTSVGVDFTAMSRRSFGVDTPSSLEQFRQGTGLTNPYPKVGPVVISEIMYHPPDIGTNDNVVEEFIELRNLTESPVALYDPAHPTNGWRLRKGVDFDFAPGTMIAPTNYLLVVSFDPVNDPTSLAAFRSRYGTNSALVGPYIGKLDNGGEKIALLKPDRPQADGSVPYIPVEQIQYGDQAPWPANADGLGSSLQRVSLSGYVNDPTNWVAAAPTPGPAGVSDRDGDGMPDDWEIQYNFNVADPSDATQDADNDGLTNLQEYLAGTHPRNASSYLKIDTVVPADRLVQIEFVAQAGKTYSVMYRQNFEDSTWVKLIDIQAQPASQAITVYDTPLPGEPRRFYRLVTPNVP